MQIARTVTTVVSSAKGTLKPTLLLIVTMSLQESVNTRLQLNGIYHVHGSEDGP